MTATEIWLGDAGVDAEGPFLWTYIETIWTYQVREEDLASNAYRILGWLKRKPRILTTACLSRLCELIVMAVMPGLTLGYEVAIRHEHPTVRGAKIILKAKTTSPENSANWNWEVEATDARTGERIAICALTFRGQIDRVRYQQRQVNPLLAARSLGVKLWISALDAFVLLTLLALPVQVAFLARHLWASRFAEVALVIVYFAHQKGFFKAIKDLFTIRPVSTQAANVPAPRKAEPNQAEKGESKE